MQTKQTPFRYRKARKMVSWGCRFDSLTELKFAISIREDYEFLRERVAIYYHRGTRKPTDHLSGPYQYYIPDFLIRHKRTGEAFLIEIKPRAFQGHPQLALRTELAENYIRWKNFDWKFKIVYDDEIILTEEQLEAYQECCKLKTKSAFKIWFEDFNRKFDRSSPSLFKNVSDSKMVEFIMFGTVKQGRFHQQ